MKQDIDKILEQGGVHFLPWIGEKYDEGLSLDESKGLIPCVGGNGKKILILGESHYCGDMSEATLNLTRNVVQRYLGYLNGEEFESWMNTFRKFIRALVGREIDKEEEFQLWKRLSFYNYVQSALTGVRFSPYEEQFEESVKPFFEVLKQLLPDCIIAWGYRLYDALPGGKEYEGESGPQFSDGDGKEYDTWIYHVDGHEIRVLQMRHPSTGFSWDYWHKIIRDFLSQ